MTVFSAPAFDEHELVTFCSDRDSGLRAIIAVHNSALGPAVGGCRMFPYASDTEALHDVLRLSRGMTYKSALAGLPMGGGKSVIIGDPKSQKSRALLLAMGDFINSQNGRYVAAEDSGTGVEDIRVMSERTAWVSGMDDNEYGGDPSPSTALGVFLAAESPDLQVQDMSNSHFRDCRRGVRQLQGSIGFRVDSRDLDHARAMAEYAKLGCRGI